MVCLSYKKLVLPLAAVLLALICLLPAAEAAPAASPVKSDTLILSFNGYKLTAYDVQVKVHENNVLDVTERITAHFDEPKHGIYRHIPLVNKMRWQNSQETVTYTQKAKISNVSVTDGSTGQTIPTDKETGSHLLLKIGEADKTITGDKTYVISYSYALGSDGVNRFDALYYNLIGDQWDTNIGHVTFAIEMPKSFEAKNIKFMIGAAEAGLSVPYKAEGKTITGSVEEVLGKGRGLTVRLELPEGYFSGVETGNDLIWLSVSAVMLGICVLLYLFYGRNPKLQPESATTSPLTLNPAEAGYILGGECASKGRAALLIHWANQGYLAFESEEQDKVSLIKLKDADAAMRPYEQTMFNALFVNGDKVTPDEVKTQFIGIMKQVDLGVSSFFDEPAHQIYTQASSKARRICYLFTFLCIVIFSARIFGNYYSWADYALTAVCVLAFSFVIFPPVLFIDYFARKNGTGSPTGLACNSIALLLMLGLLLGLAEYADALDSATSVAVLAIGVCGLAGALIRKRTVEGNKLVSEVVGLKRVLQSASTAKNTPGQFYPLLPYAFTFGLTDKWANAFSSLELEPPGWFRGRLLNLFTTLYFSNKVSDYVSTFESGMNYYDSSSGSDGGSGGGSGGGGGGSW